MATAKKKTPAKKAVKKVTKAPAKKAAKKSPVVSKSGRKSSATSRVKKSTEAPKRKYTRKPKVEVAAPVEQLTGGETAQGNDVNEDIRASLNASAAEAAGPNPNYKPETISLATYDLYDLRDMPVLGRALFLLELESQGYLLAQMLKKPTEAQILSNLKSVEIVRLNNENKLISFTTFGQLQAEDGEIAVPMHYEGGLLLHAVLTGRAAPKEMNIMGETFVRQPKVEIISPSGELIRMR